MKNAKLILTFAMMLTSLKTYANSFSEERETHARGIMVAVDTRDHRQCRTTKRSLEDLVPLEEDLCAFDELNPLSVVVITIPTDEWDFMAEIDNSRNAEKSIRDTNAGFVRASRTNLLFILPSARTSNNMIRVAVRRHQATVAQVRVSDLSMLHEMNFGSAIVHFTLKNIPHQLTEKDRESAERIVRRVRVRSNAIAGAEREKTILDSLNVVSTINSSLNEAANTPNRFEMNLFLPDAYCRRENKCSKGDDDRLIPLGLGFSFKIRF
ncbi:hypothetical protein ACNQKP_04530 [Bdellovibrio bacteriovorus]|uniref:hypothetical protein n=1 Tax=Bdellovibrio bacteriovorus TaxID=959 RepID=UPI003AA89EDA